MTQVRRLLQRLRGLWRDSRGAIGPAIAVLGVSLLAAAGLFLDVALYYSGNRELRVATESAALAAAMDPTRAEGLASDFLARNGYDASVLRTVEVGYYCANIAQESGSRFVAAGSPDIANCPGSSRPNAVRVTTGKPSRQFLVGVLGRASPIPQLAATASAARIDEAGISATSGLLTVSNPLVNAVNELLGGLLGIKLQLSTADIEALLGGNVDAGLFFDALATRAGFDGTYGELTKGTFDLQDIALAAADAAGSPATRSALNAFGTMVGRGYMVPLNGLFAVGVWRNMPVGEADVKPALRAGLNAYQLVSYAVQEGPVVVALSDVIQPLVPPPLLTGTEVRIGAAVTGHPDRPRFAFGPARETKVGTSMLRLQVNVTLLNLPLGVARANVPILIDVAAAEAEIADIDCMGQVDQAANTTVRVQARSALVKAYIGTAPANALTKPLPPIRAEQIGHTEIAQVGLRLVPLLPLEVVSVKGRAIAEPVLGGDVRESLLTFGPAPGNGTIGTPARPGSSLTVPNGAQVGTTVQGLVDSLTGDKDGLRVCLLGGLCGVGETVVRSDLLPSITRPLTGVVAGVIDPLLTNVLIALGVQLGHASVWVNGVRCGVPVLI
ncbi:TadG family pilus assembly protein [Novosphingobium soli]|uniref:TadG family pilus assembly protein n=1 Tax=Novosphingobium soli TaxID=574956 RepID=A0ABV6CVB4_9SPHN